MRPPIYVRPLTAKEQKELEQGLHASDGFVLRRSQVVLASSEGQSPSEIAQRVGRTSQTVRNVIRAFNHEGLACLGKKSSRPKRLRTVLDESNAEALYEMLHHSPRAFGRPTSTWTLELAAEISYEQGLCAHKVSIETIRTALSRLGKSWQRAKHWVVSPDPQYRRKKGPETG